MVALENSDSVANLSIYWYIKVVLLLSFSECLSGLNLSKSRSNGVSTSCRYSGYVRLFPGILTFIQGSVMICPSALDCRCEPSRRL